MLFDSVELLRRGGYEREAGRVFQLLVKAQESVSLRKERDRLASELRVTPQPQGAQAPVHEAAQQTHAPARKKKR
ncbi:MAG TPA: hypothetical protein VLS89_14995, partial [Candidatus Nanopelagicales bacterium]|nr:hypothetical protein [Candidatus Nanopelagicales bacterium]